VALQDSVAVFPAVTELGLALKVTTGIGVETAPATVTVVDCVAEPPGAVHVNPNLVVLKSAPVTFDPRAPSEPLQPPEASHASAPVEFQVSFVLCPLATLLGPAVRVTCMRLCRQPDSLPLDVEDSDELALAVV
jgi:hypothetical protein